VEAAPRIVVADDSGLMRRVVAGALRRAGADIVGEAADGDEALALCTRLAPDVMTLDLTMPGLDGIGVLKALRASPALSALPVVVVSAFSPRHGARAVDALAEGAFELVAKPTGPNGVQSFTDELQSKIQLAVASRSRAPVVPAAAAPQRGGRARAGRAPLVVIASSTGGPRALAEFVPALPTPLGAGALIVQHMPPGFTHSLATRLDKAGRLTVREAADGDALSPDVALLAPGGRHLRLDADRRVRLGDGPPVGGLRPRADLTIVDAARTFGERVVLVVLTGMGADGTDGAREVKARGGQVLVEAEETCTVYGMPRAVADAGLADSVLALGELAPAVAELAGVRA